MRHLVKIGHRAAINVLATFCEAKDSRVVRAATSGCGRKISRWGEPLREPTFACFAYNNFFKFQDSGFSGVLSVGLELASVLIRGIVKVT